MTRSRSVRLVKGWLLVVLVCIFVSSCASSAPSVNSGATVVPLPGYGLPQVPHHSDRRFQRQFRPVGYFSYQLPIVPITFRIGTDGSFSIDVSGGVPTPLGEISFSAGIATQARDDRPLRVESVGVTELVICEAGSDRRTCRGYAIRTGRKVRISLNGHFQETIQDHLVTIIASPGSTVTVEDSSHKMSLGPRPAAHIDVEHFAFWVRSRYTEVDLERRQGGVEKDLSYDHVTGKLGLLNGDRVAGFRQYRAGQDSSVPGDVVFPDEEDCAGIPAGDWQSSFTAADLRADVVVACVFTAEKDFGYLVIGHNLKARPISYFIYSYIWVR